MAPSLRRSIRTSGEPSFTGRCGACLSFTSAARFISLSAPRHFGAALFQKRLQARLGLFVALGDAGGERFGRKARRRIAAGNARQELHYGEVGEGRVAGDALRQLKTFGEPFA